MPPENPKNTLIHFFFTPWNILEVILSFRQQKNYWVLSTCCVKGMLHLYKRSGRESNRQPLPTLSLKTNGALFQQGDLDICLLFECCPVFHWIDLLDLIEPVYC